VPAAALPGLQDAAAGPKQDVLALRASL